MNPANTQSTPVDSMKKVVIRIRRQDAPDKPPRWEEFAVPHRPNLNIIACLQYIAANEAQAAASGAQPVR